MLCAVPAEPFAMLADRLTAAARDTKALDKLEERQRSEFDRTAARREAYETDEMALNVFRGNAA